MLSSYRGLRFRETAFLGPETQLQIRASNNCCAVLETKRELRAPPIPGLFGIPAATGRPSFNRSDAATATAHPLMTAPPQPPQSR
jgi:hypothetical protein